MVWRPQWNPAYKLATQSPQSVLNLSNVLTDLIQLGILQPKYQPKNKPEAPPLVEHIERKLAEKPSERQEPTA